jgi:hypothetical protein
LLSVKCLSVCVFLFISYSLHGCFFHLLLVLVYLFVFLLVCLTSSSPSIFCIDFALLMRSNFSNLLALCSEVFCWGP